MNKSLKSSVTENQLLMMLLEERSTIKENLKLKEEGKCQ